MPDFILPVPLHKKRLRQRGFNQALELVRPIAKQFRCPINKYDCIRIRNTDAQSTLSLKQRHSNIKDAFSCNRWFDAAHIAIFDDVITTGNTLNELAKTLKHHGAHKVSAWCIANTEQTT